MRPTHRLAITGLFLLFSPGPTVAQTVVVGGGAHIETYRFGPSSGPSSLSVFTVPAQAAVTFGRRGIVTLSSGWAVGRARLNEGEIVIEGPTDTQLAATIRIADGLASITGMVTLPTGRASNDPEEAAVATLLASYLIPFRTSNWGTGGGAGLRVTTQRRIGDFGSGLSVGYFVGNNFTPRENQDFVFRPGNNLVVRAAFDRSLGQAGKASVQFTYRRYGSDQLDNTNLYQSGNRYRAVASYAFAASQTASAVVYGGVSRRAAGAFFPELSPLGSQTLLILGGGGRLRIGSALFMPSLDLRALRNRSQPGPGVDLRVGATLDVGIAGTSWKPSAYLHLGRVSLIEGVNSGFVGFDLGLNLLLGSDQR